MRIDRPVITLTAEGEVTDVAIDVANLNKGPGLSHNTVLAVSVFLDLGSAAVIDLEAMIPNPEELSVERWSHFRRFSLSEQGKGAFWLSPPCATSMRLRFRATTLDGVEPSVTCQIGT